MTKPTHAEVNDESYADDAVGTPDLDALFSEMDVDMTKYPARSARYDTHRLDDAVAILPAMPADVIQHECEGGEEAPKRRQSREEDNASTVENYARGSNTKHVKRYRASSSAAESRSNDIVELWQQASAA